MANTKSILNRFEKVNAAAERELQLHILAQRILRNKQAQKASK